jgi:cation-transporting ATPase 13A3/4/5
MAMVEFVVNGVMQIYYGERVSSVMLCAVDIVTIAVPPTLPAVMSAGRSYALSRVKKKKMFCISPQLLNVAKKLKLMCFDKTGTEGRR